MCTEPPLFPYITRSFILLDDFKLLIITDQFLISRRPKELCGWHGKANDAYIKWLDRVAKQ